MSYTLFYHTECKGFFGRGWAPLAMLKHTNTPYEIKGAADVPQGVGFAVPMMTFPEGFSIAQTGVIAATLGATLGLAPTGIADNAKAQQIVADMGDAQGDIFSGKPAERINKWLDYLASRLESNG